MASPPQSSDEAIAQPPGLTVEEAIERARGLATAGGRRLLGITGAPGAGKSTLARLIVDALRPLAVAVPMDGFHLANRELVRLGRRDRKGAVDTFDAAGFVSLLERLRPATGSASGSPGQSSARADSADVVYAPSFERDLEEPIAGAIPVATGIPLVVTEGNYLLVDHGAWGRVRALLDEAWFVETDEADRLERLIARHIAFGKSPADARRWSLGTDQVNADLVATTRRRADRIIYLG